MKLGPAILGSVISFCATWLLFHAFSALARKSEEDNAERDRIGSQLKRHSCLDLGDCVPVRLIETDDACRLVVIGDYRKDTFVVLQRFADGYRIIYPDHGAPAAAVRSTLLRLESVSP